VLKEKCTARNFIIYTPPNIIRLIISRRMRWTRHVTRKGEMRNANKILVGVHETKRPPERFRNQSWIGFNWLKI
jgi:hypothetical protein